jgi:flagellin
MAPDPIKEEIMGLRINQNIAAMNAYRNLSVTDGQMAKSLEKLSSGFRINRAADDAAGLSISEGLRAQVGGLKVAVRNAQDGISVVQAAEGAMNEVHSILGRMRDLAVQASSSGSQDTNARTAAQTELTQLNAELNRIGSILGTASLDLVNSASSALTALDTAIQTVSTNRANLGAMQNRLEHTISNLSVAAENFSASESRIRDTDMAQEMMSFTRSQILTQAGTAMLAQANQAPQQVLQLLRG